MSENNQKAVAKIVFVLLAIVVMATLILWSASAIFMAWNGAPIEKATPTMILKYWEIYGQNKQYKTSFLVSFGVPFAIFIILPLILWLMHSERRSLHGDAQWAKPSDIRQMGLFKGNSTSLLVGKYKGQWLQYSGNQFLGMIAPTRSGKGVGIVIPNLLNYSHSVVVLDIKGENFDLTSGFRKKYGQKVFKFAPFDFDKESGISYTHRYNPLSYVSDSPATQVSDIMKLAFMLYPDPSGEDADDNFFPAQARALFLGLVLFLKNTNNEDGTPARCTIGEVLRLSGGNGKNLKDYILEDMLGTAEGYEPREGLPKACIDKLSAFANQSDNTRSSILGTFTSPLDLWLNSTIDNATSGDDFDLRKVRKEKKTIYVVIPPDRLSEARVLINMLYSQLLAENLNQLPSQNKSLKYQCLLLMDEFTAAGPIPVIQKGAAYIAGYNMRLLIINQNTSQLVENYGKAGADTLLGNIELLVMYAPSPKPLTDAEEYSKLLGYQTVKAKSKSRQQNGNHRSESESDQRRALMLPQELLQMPETDEILVKRGKKPIYCSKIIYHEDPAFNGKILEPSAVPSWNINKFITEFESTRYISRAPSEENTIEPFEASAVSFDKTINKVDLMDSKTVASADFFSHHLFDLVFDPEDNEADIIAKIDAQAAANGADIDKIKQIEEAEYQEKIKAEMSDIDNPASDEVPDSYSVDEIDLDDIPPIGENEEDNSISPADENDDLDPEEESNNY